jgi:PAS domain S-box-containing protein
VESVLDYAIFMLDPEGNIVTWNAGAQRLKGYSAGEIIGKHFSIFYPRDDVQRGKPEWELEAAVRDGRVGDEGWRVRKDGTVFWANVVVTALYDADGTLRGFAKVTRDLTDQKRIEDFRTRFIANAAHELRTPISSVMGFAEMLRDRDRLTTEQVDECVAALNRSSERLYGLVQNLLDLSRLDEGRLSFKLQAVGLDAAVRLALGTNQPPPEKNLLIAIPEHLEVLADPVRLQQVLSNLLSNAYQYGGSRIDIEAKAHEDEAFISVADNGPGIPSDFAAYLFEPFRRGLEAEGRPGAGLGLSIVRSLVEAFGGDISYEQNQPRGARFIMRLRQP